MAVYRQSVLLDAKSLEAQQGILFLQLNSYGHIPYESPSLTTGRS
jgi:hypothetical protein